MISWSRITMGSGLAAAFWLAASCGAQVQVDNPQGSQTHFLRSCPGGACGDGLECTCGVCTLPCTQASDCAGASASASCESAAASCSQARSVCSIECNLDSDCANLGEGFACQQGECRGEPLLASNPGRGARPGVGEVCISPDEAFPQFAGFSANEFGYSGSHAGCGGVAPDVDGSLIAYDSDGICVTYHFTGLVSCPEGQAVPSDGRSCRTPFGEPVIGPVAPQDPARPPSVASFCSCRCGGSGPEPLCNCPNGMICEAMADPDRPGSGPAFCVFPLAEAAGSSAPSPAPESEPAPPPDRG
ncbi:MAG TPA: hypothetical protein VJU61_12155 [Polyangiaceae bacterium]|nr:hypothetical protein [Polyangiaceae bacterium]